MPHEEFKLLLSALLLRRLLVKNSKDIIHILLWALLISIAVALTSCNSSSFRGGGKSKSKAKDTQQITETPKKCEDQKKIQGIDVAFVIDNSGSNRFTDCGDNPKRIGNDAQGFELYECQVATNREKAVLNVYDVIEKMTKDEEAPSSQISVSSFPKNSQSGYDWQSKEWMAVKDQKKADLQNSLQFTRKPGGMTPYGDGLLAAREMVSKLPESKKSKLVVFVTDGEPTDENPSTVKDFAKTNFADKGVKIVTVLVAGNKSVESRKAEHASYLKGLGYSTGVIDELLGRSGTKGLIDSISTKKLEITDSKGLTKALESLIVSAVACK